MIREGHSFTEMALIVGFDGGQFLFAGKGSNGLAQNDTWRLNRTNIPTSTEYSYAWTELDIPGPPSRYEHSASVTLGSALTIFGGRNETGAVLDDAWSLYKQLGAYKWDPINVGSSTPPSPRFGHAAFYEEISISDMPVKRVVVYGGTAVPGQTPIDNNVYELRLTSPTTGSWHVIPQVDLGHGFPAPRFGHTLTHSPALVDTFPGNPAHASYLVAGQLSSSTFSDEFWILWTFQDGTCGWRRRNLNIRPSARARHQAAFDPYMSSAGRLYLFGGESTTPADKAVYYVHPHTASNWGVWTQMQSAVAGHSFVFDREHTLSRVIEVYDPSTNAWQNYTNAPFCWDHSYPLNFVVPGGSGANGRLLTVGHEPQSHWLDLPAPGQLPSQGWQTLSGLTTGFQVESAVQYRPGKILAVSGATGVTKTLDATNLAAGWQATSNSLESRYDPNLVLLANGTVLALGGAKDHAEIGQPAEPVQDAQLWEPAAGGGPGAWTTPNELADQPSIRAYHATAVLLPDGRVLCSGGEHAVDKYRAEVYCPPYLYKTGTSQLAARPVITESPVAIKPGQTFRLMVNTPWVTAVNLLRPGATTHAFDQNQRFVPLSFVWAGNGCLQVTAPPSLDHAPVGDYLLFVLGSADRSDVPSLAKWIRVDAPESDAIPPGTVTNLTVLIAGRNSVSLGWKAPGDDGGTGTAQSFEVRYSTAPIDACNFGAATQAPNAPTPGPAGTEHCMVVDGLNVCETYYFALRTSDESGNVSLLSNVVSTTTDCSGYELTICDDGGLFAQSGGGGGEEQGAVIGGGKAGGESVLSQGDEALWQTLNSIDAGVPGGDVLVMREVTGSSADPPPIRVFNAGADRVELRSITLGRIANRIGAGVAIEGSDVSTGTITPVEAVFDGGGIECTDGLAEPGGLGQKGSPGETWRVSLGPSGGRRLLVVESSDDANSGEGTPGYLRVEIPEVTERWRTVGTVLSRRGSAMMAVDVGDAHEARITFEGFLRIHSITSLTNPEPASIEWLTLTGAFHAQEGDVTSELAAVGGSPISLEANEWLRADFAAASAETSVDALYVLRVAGEGSAAVDSEMGSESARSATSRAALSLGLGEAFPNPAREATTLVVSVPSAERVRVTLFDVNGRALRTLVDDVLPAGAHAVRWDGRRNDGVRAAPGLYFARMERAGWRSEKKLVLIAP
jgi:hypothetical protein